MPRGIPKPTDRRPRQHRCAHCGDTLNKEDARLFHRFCGPICKRLHNGEDTGDLYGRRGRAPRKAERARTAAGRELVQAEGR